MPYKSCKEHGAALCKSAAIVLLSGFVPLIACDSARASATAALEVNAQILRRLSATAVMPLNAGKIAATVNTGSFQIGLDGEQSAVTGGSALGSAAAAGLQIMGSQANILIKAGLGTNGLQLQTSKGASGLTLSKIQLGSNPNGLTKTVTLQMGTGTNNTSTVALQGQATGVNSVGGGFVWNGSAPATGSYTGVLNITIDRI